MIFLVIKAAIIISFLGITTKAIAQQNRDEQDNSPEHLVFSETRIEGQFGTVKTLIVTAEKRPEFKPMALKINFNDLEWSDINPDAFAEDKYQKPFEVELPK